MIDYSGPASRWLPEFRARATSAMAAAGDWLTGRQRVAVWREFRDAGTNPLDLARKVAVSPNAVEGAHEATAGVVPDLPAAQLGEPARVRPPDVGDVGAWVAQSLSEPKANVSRTLSLVPVTNRVWRALVDSHYSRGDEFFEETWARCLTRPQAELLAARTTVLNECFY
jgi:hypothetical protein